MLHTSKKSTKVVWFICRQYEFSMMSFPFAHHRVIDVSFEWLFYPFPWFQIISYFQNKFLCIIASSSYHIFVWFIDYPSKCCTFNISSHFLWSPCIPSPIAPCKFHIGRLWSGQLWSISLMYGASILLFRIALSIWNRHRWTKLVK